MPVSETAPLTDTTNTNQTGVVNATAATKIASDSKIAVAEKERTLEEKIDFAMAKANAKINTLKKETAAAATNQHTAAISERSKSATPEQSAASTSSTMPPPVAPPITNTGSSTAPPISVQGTKAAGPKPWSLEDFDIGKSLGSGKFGKVYLARLSANRSAKQQLVAMKVLNKEQLISYGVAHQLKHEIELHSQLRHPNILKFYAQFQDEKRVYMISAFAENGDVFSALKASAEGKFPEERAAKYISQLMLALKYMHKFNVIHRDIKPENLLLSARDDIKLADFGWAQKDISENRRTTLCGTADYLAPEMLDGDAYDESVDVWTVGVLLFEFMTGTTPFYDKDQAATALLIQQCQLDIPSDVPEDAADLITKLLQRKPGDRIKLKAALQHPWLQKFGRQEKPKVPKKV